MRLALGPILGLQLLIPLAGAQPSFRPVSRAGEFVITGNPENALGATWTFKDTVGGVVYDLRGVLYKPAGPGPFPAVLVSHGTGGTAGIYARRIAPEFAGWGYAVLGTHYTHSDGVPCGLPGDCANQADWGPSPANVLRGLKAWELLAGLGYVDSSRIMALGHSRGAFVTTALAAEAPGRFRAAAHTAGGAVPNNFPRIMPRDSTVRKIRCPYLSQHGELDTIVPLAAGRRLDSVLAREGVVHRLDLYPEFGHDGISGDPLVLQRTRAWFDSHGGNVAIRLFPRRKDRPRSGAGIYDLLGRWIGNPEGSRRWRFLD